MRCPKCRGRSEVTNSRVRAEGEVVVRRRECRECSFRWSTSEVAKLDGMQESLFEQSQGSMKEVAVAR